MREKYILITGSSRGIGKSAALLFASKGYHVFLNCRRSFSELEQVKKQIEKKHGSCTCIPADVGNPEEVRGMFQKIYSACPCLDILVNNAGVSHLGLLSEMTDSQWELVLQTNLSSAFYCSREALPPMIHRKKGKIINISSMWGTVGASCEAAYSAAKSGVHGLTRALAKELAPSNIQVNAVACGVIDTKMNHMLNPEERKNLEYEIPSGRFGTPEEAAQAIYDIAHFPEYITGQVIGIDGGYI